MTKRNTGRLNQKLIRMVTYGGDGERTKVRGRDKKRSEILGILFK